MYLGDCPSLYGYDDDMGLGKFKLKNVVKSVTKAATQVAKVAVKPAAIVAASSLQAVGLRNAAEKAGKAVGLTEAERKIAKVGGTAIDVGAAVVGATVAAPYIASAAATAGHAAAAAGAKGLLLAKTLGSKANLLKPFTSLLSKKKAAPGEAPADAGGDTISTITQDVREATAAAAPVLRRAKQVRAAFSPSAPSAPAEASSGGGDAGGAPAFGPSPSYSMAPGGGDAGSSGAPAGGGGADAGQTPPDAAAAPEGKKVPTWLLFAPALLLL